MGARTGLAQSTLGNYKRGKNQAEWTSTFEKLADGLDMPLPLRQALGLTGDASPVTSRPGAGAVAGVQADTFDLQLLAEAVGRNGTDVKRRDMLALAAQLGATAALAQSGVWERLAYALTNPSAMNKATIKEMEARPVGFHDTILRPRISIIQLGITDAAGRQWDMRPYRGRPPRRVRWRHEWPWRHRRLPPPGADRK